MYACNLFSTSAFGRTHSSKTGICFIVRLWNVWYSKTTIETENEIEIVTGAFAPLRGSCELIGEFKSK